MDKKTLFTNIERCREEMLALSEKHGLNSNVVLATSKRLDELINDYLKRSS